MSYNNNPYESMSKEELLDMAAEKFAHLFWQQILWKNEQIRKKKSEAISSEEIAEEEL